MDDYLEGFEFGLLAFDARTNAQRGDDIAMLCETQGGALLEGFNDALTFVSWLAAKAVS